MEAEVEEAEVEEATSQREVDHDGKYVLYGAWGRHFLGTVFHEEVLDLRREAQLGWQEDETGERKRVVVPVIRPGAEPVPDDEPEPPVDQDVEMTDEDGEAAEAPEPPAPPPPPLLEKIFVNELLKYSLHVQLPGGEMFVFGKDRTTVWLEEKKIDRTYISWRAGSTSSGVQSPVFETAAWFYPVPNGGSGRRTFIEVPFIQHALFGVSTSDWVKKNYPNWYGFIEDFGLHEDDVVKNLGQELKQKHAKEGKKKSAGPKRSQAQLLDESPEEMLVRGALAMVIFCHNWRGHNSQARHSDLKAKAARAIDGYCFGVLQGGATELSFDGNPDPTAPGVFSLPVSKHAGGYWRAAPGEG